MGSMLNILGNLSMRHVTEFIPGFGLALTFLSSFVVFHRYTLGRMETSEPFLGKTCDRCFLEDAESFRLWRNNSKVSLCLSYRTLEYTDPKGLSTLVDLSDAIGANVSEPSNAVRSKRPKGRNRDRRRRAQRPEESGSSQLVQEHLLQIFTYIIAEPRAGCRRRKLCPKQRRQASHLELVTSDGAVARKWATAINNILGGVGEPESISEEQGSRIRSRRSVGPGRRLLVLINPISGRGRSLSIWKNTLRPMLEQSQASLTAVISTRRGEIEDVMKLAGQGGGNATALTSISNKAKGSVGTLNGSEPIPKGVQQNERDGENGNRHVLDVGQLDDFDAIVVVGGDGTFFEVLQGIYARPDSTEQLARLSLGAIPAGSGNGLAKTVCEESGEEFGAIGASFLAAKGSSKKMDLLRTEVGDKKYLGFLNVGWGMVSDVDIESEAYRWMGSFRFTFGTIVRIIGLRYYRGRISYLPGAATDMVGDVTISLEDSSEVSSSCMPPISEPVDEAKPQAPLAFISNGVKEEQTWVTVEGEFILGDISQVKYVSHDMPMAPASRLGDGLMDLFFLRRGAGRLAIIKMFMAMEKAEHLSMDNLGLEWHRVTAFRIEPLTEKGKLTVDGELVDYLPLQQHIWPKATNIMCTSSRYELV